MQLVGQSLSARWCNAYLKKFEFPANPWCRRHCKHALILVYDNSQSSAYLLEEKTFTESNIQTYRHDQLGRIGILLVNLGTLYAPNPVSLRLSERVSSASWRLVSASNHGRKDMS